jgi:hypothetical protein
MNRIILIGNGFDLAHGLKTSYANFIDWYWKEWGRLLLNSLNFTEEDDLCAFSLKIDGERHWSGVVGNCRSEGFLSALKPFDGRVLVDFIKSRPEMCSFSYKSRFFAELCKRLDDKQWVDIENVFFMHLCDDSEKPEEVNKELSCVRNRLIGYLNMVLNGAPKELFKAEIKKMMLAPFNKRDFAINAMDVWKSMIRQRFNYPKGVWLEMISSCLNPNSVWIEQSRIENFFSDYSEQIKYNGIEGIGENELPMGFFLPDRVLMLNFNYTSVADSYFPQVDRLSVNHIHGELSNPESVIFGYGDEIDENYKKIANKNDNEYLTNIKSIKYLESPNYRNLLDFIESDTYQIYIMGHSCGSSDRTLLNTLFEHKNCVSIKPFYFIKKDGTDNYMELVQNISRNFTDMKLMRDRVVNKEFCEPYSDARETASSVERP